MPFKSEKQRRMMWAEHPDIAERWAHEHPDEDSGLPTYAHGRSTSPELKRRYSKKKVAEILTKVASRLANLRPKGRTALERFVASRNT